MPKQPDERSPYAQALEWTSRVMSISMELIAPPLIGYWLDRRMGTLPLFLIVGVALGFITATMSLVQLSKRPPNGDKR